VAADIWSEGSVSICGVLQYHIDETFANKIDKKNGVRSGFALVEELIGAQPVDKAAHTGDHIEELLVSKQTEMKCSRVVTILTVIYIYSILYCIQQYYISDLLI
jgi:hypothetical protein